MQHRFNTWKRILWQLPTEILCLCLCSYRNSNLWSKLVHTFPSVTSHSILHTLDICFIHWYWWGTTVWIIVNTLASITKAFVPVIHLRLSYCSVTILLLQHS
jgi:hypothetical protein